MADDSARELAKIANVLAAIATKDMNKSATATLLINCGFTNKEIAALTDSSEGTIRSMISASKRKRPEGNG